MSRINKLALLVNPRYTFRIYERFIQTHPFSPDLQWLARFPIKHVKAMKDLLDESFTNDTVINNIFGYDKYKENNKSVGIHAKGSYLHVFEEGHGSMMLYDDKSFDNKDKDYIVFDYSKTQAPQPEMSYVLGYIESICKKYPSECEILSIDLSYDGNLDANGKNPYKWINERFNEMTAEYERNLIGNYNKSVKDLAQLEESFKEEISLIESGAKPVTKSNKTWCSTLQETVYDYLSKFTYMLRRNFKPDIDIYNSSHLLVLVALDKTTFSYTTLIGFTHKMTMEKHDRNVTNGSDNIATGAIDHTRKIMEYLKTLMPDEA